jgi:hypothetical protein
MRASPPIAPHGPEQDTYLVLDNFGGRLGRAWRETDEEATDRETLILNLLSGEYNNPVRIIAFNAAEGWCRDVRWTSPTNCADATLSSTRYRSRFSSSSRRTDVKGSARPTRTVTFRTDSLEPTCFAFRSPPRASRSRGGEMASVRHSAGATFICNPLSAYYLGRMFEFCLPTTGANDPPAALRRDHARDRRSGATCPKCFGFAYRLPPYK